VRRRLLILLLFCLPFQFVWGAAASYCKHEQSSAVSHVGHHSHEHQGKLQSASGESTPDKKSGVADEDSDCDSCHISCAQPLPSVPVECDSEVAPHTLSGTVLIGNSPHVPTQIERPNWALAA
jgi:hypothetical protein